MLLLTDSKHRERGPPDGSPRHTPYGYVAERGNVASAKAELSGAHQIRQNRRVPSTCRDPLAAVLHCSSAAMAGATESWESTRCPSVSPYPGGLPGPRSERFIRRGSKRVSSSLLRLHFLCPEQQHRDPHFSHDLLGHTPHY